MDAKLLGAGRQAEIFEWGEGRALKLYRRTEAGRDASVEAENTRRAHAAGAPVPGVFETVTVEGRPGAVYERLSGPTMLSHLVRQPWRVNGFARQMAEVHAQMHRCSGAGLPAQAERVRGLAQWIEAQSIFAPGLKATLLRAANALPDGDRLCHGDLHPDNVLLTARGPRVIDWMNAWCGHPLADVARTSVILSLGDPPPGFVQRAFIAVFRSLFQALYLRHYFDAQTDYARAELRAWELPLAVARLADGIAEERGRLLRFITDRAREVEHDGVLSRPRQTQA
jgi:aminoglycoside phosphotransferase (APT) family kinase protein